MAWRAVHCRQHRPGATPPAALARSRDRLAGQIKAELDAGTPVHGAAGLTAACQALTGAAQRLAAHH